LSFDRNSLPFQWVLSDDLTILCVDDDPIQREFCTVYLSTPTVTVETAESAEAALEILETRNFDAALFDVDMPGLSGIELVTKLRADPKFDDLPIMVVTGREDMVSIDQAYDAGATAFMCKPVNWRLLSHQIRFMIRAHKAIRRMGDGHG
jgi:DNA-binding response OmpR family regulator